MKLLGVPLNFFLSGCYNKGTKKRPPELPYFIKEMCP